MGPTSYETPLYICKNIQRRLFIISQEEGSTHCLRSRNYHSLLVLDYLNDDNPNVHETVRINKFHKRFLRVRAPSHSRFLEPRLWITCVHLFLFPPRRVFLVSRGSSYNSPLILESPVGRRHGVARNNVATFQGHNAPCRLRLDSPRFITAFSNCNAVPPLLCSSCVARVRARNRGTTRGQKPRDDSRTARVFPSARSLAFFSFSFFFFFLFRDTTPPTFDGSRYFRGFFIDAIAGQRFINMPADVDSRACCARRDVRL